MKTDKVLVTCPKCGHGQREPPAVYSTVCKKCRQHSGVRDLARPAAKVQAPPRELKHISCFKCGAALEVAFTAQSTMCKRCSSHVDLRDYHIANAVSKNFKTKGRFVIEAGGFLFNTDTIAGEAVLKGRLLGKLAAEYSLEIYSSAEIKGSFKTTRLIIPPGNHFRWPETISLLSAEVGGELVANLNAAETVLLKSTGRFFGQ